MKIYKIKPRRVAGPAYVIKPIGTYKFDFQIPSTTYAMLLIIKYDIVGSFKMDMKTFFFKKEG